MPSSRRAGGDQRREPARLELLLDGEALLARDAAVVGFDEFLAGQLVEALGESLGEAPAVDEDDRAAMAADELEDRGVDGRPDAGTGLRARGRAAGLFVGRQDLADGGHVLDRDDDLEFERLAGAGIDDGDLAAGADPAEEAADRLERPLRGGEADPLRGGVVPGRAEGLEAFQAEGPGGRRASSRRWRGPRR